ncbi:Hypothetical_protein [Hexamita inflata]|uniref:Hypothetical_protein n=1 Tax=Hexamita inflata TaxID=28002 RepID=A0AA86QGT5_9EUKA|nr:Hypothetical protein HINF_LOCUS44021 [Hexamita inflata]
MHDLNAEFGPVGTSIGRIARNNMSIILTNIILSQQCQEFIREKIYNYPNNPDYNTQKFNLDQLVCFYEQDFQIQIPHSVSFNSFRLYLIPHAWLELPFVLIYAIA